MLHGTRSASDTMTKTDEEVEEEVKRLLDAKLREWRDVQMHAI
jgi:hypothetical protein